MILLIGAIILGFITGHTADVAQSVTSSAKNAVTISLGLIGIMAVWLGLMRIAEDAGLIKIFARALSPLLRRLFPDIPQDHPAMGSIVLNISANASVNARITLDNSPPLNIFRSHSISLYSISRLICGFLLFLVSLNGSNLTEMGLSLKKQSKYI